MDISDEIVFPIYDEMHLNHGKLEIKCTGNDLTCEYAKTGIQGWDRRDTSSCVETRDFTYIPFFN